MRLKVYSLEPREEEVPAPSGGFFGFGIVTYNFVVLGASKAGKVYHDPVIFFVRLTKLLRPAFPCVELGYWQSRLGRLVISDLNLAFANLLTQMLRETLL